MKLPFSKSKAVSSEMLALVAFFLGCLVLTYIIGIATVRYNLFPYPQIRNATQELLVGLEYKQEYLPWQLFKYDGAPPERTVQHAPAEMMPGATLVSAFTTDEAMHEVRIVEADGTEIMKWQLNWKDLWPGAPEHIPASIMARPQKHLHGLAMADNGDIVFNFTELAMFRVNPCGQLVWKLDRRAHHSVNMAEDGSFWVPGVITHEEPVARFPNHQPPFEEFTALHVSPDGEVLQEFSINGLLQEQEKPGLLYLSTLNELTPIVTSDTLHVNDIEVFPSTMPEGVFKHGDIMISLRNINTVWVVDPDTLETRYINTGSVQRQHDPDFVDGDTISIFDNNNLQSEWLDNASGKRGGQGQKSLITTISARTNQVLSRFDGGEGGPFFTDLMGAHQQLENGNMMIVEARAGRIFEVTPAGNVVWEYYNTIDTDLLGSISYAKRLPVWQDAEFFAQARAACE